MSIFDLDIIEILTQVIDRMFIPYIILLYQYHINGSNYNSEVQEVIVLVILGIQKGCMH